MSNKAAISLTTGLEDTEKVMIALLVAVGAAESGRPTITFLTKEAVRLALEGTAIGTACEGCPSLPDLMKRYDAAGGQLLVCPICFNSKKLDEAGLVSNAKLGGSVQLWEWIGDGATTFSY
jgi:predicted peroxiredoxin